jgi:hypothetical protein
MGLNRMVLAPMALASLRRLGVFVALFVLGVVLVGVGGCGVSRNASGGDVALSKAFRDVRRQKAQAVLVLMPNTQQAESVWEGLNGDLASEFDVVTVRVERDTPVGAVAAAIQRVKPTCLVLMNNPTVRLYHQYQHDQPRGSVFPPAVIVMTSFLEQTYRDVQNATGIAYEVPGVIQFVKLRSIVSRPVKRVGVVYRAPFASFLARQQQLARAEQVELVGEEVSRDPGRSEVSAALGRLFEKDRVDTLWVLNDNALLSPALLSSVWIPAVNENHVPVIVGVQSLVSKDYPVGSFAMLPDHVALGVQAANLVFDLSDHGWKVGDRPIQLPISIRTTVQLRQVRDFGLREGGLDGVDQVVGTAP